MKNADEHRNGIRRRGFLGLAGAGGAALLAACAGLAEDAAPTGVPTGAPATTAAPTGTGIPTATTVPAAGDAIPVCVVRPEMTEGPYFVDDMLNRSDIRSEPSDGSVAAGAALVVVFNVLQLGGAGCTPLPGAQVDIWHCDAGGVYSGVVDRGRGGDASGKSFLRGYQLTGGDGAAQFITIYPGWYPGRAVHIHFKIRSGAPGGGTYEFTSQLFFDETVTAAVYRSEPYALHGLPDTPNERDGIFRSGGSQLLLTPEAVDGGYRAAFNIALDLADSATGAVDSGGPGGF